MAKRRTRGRSGRSRRKSWSFGKTLLVTLASFCILVITVGAVIIANQFSKIQKTELSPEKLSISSEVKHETGYLNIALFGLDSREGELESGTRSDTIMIASLNRETLEVKLTSVYRDTLLQQDDGTLNKANAAYSYGGPEEAIALLNRNLDLDIQYYVGVNFNVMIDVVNELGGVMIDVQEEEISYINGYATEIIEVTGKDSIGIFEPGLQKLNGVQATAYSRIRGTIGSDYRRTERQRAVVEQLVSKAQKSSISTIYKVTDKVFGELSTNFTMSEIISYAKDGKNYKLGETAGFPFDKSAMTLSQIGSIVIPITLEDNVIKLHEFFFGNDGYTASDTVQRISNKIVDRVGDREIVSDSFWKEDGNDDTGDNEQ